MRISDWSSDVCSSDLDHALAIRQSISLHDLRNDPLIVGEPRWSTGFHARIMSACEKAGFVPRVVQVAVQIQTLVTFVAAGLGVTLVPASLGNHPGKGRSEEHTSELQSLMRISYAVFCLKKKITNKKTNN